MLIYISNNTHLKKYTHFDAIFKMKTKLYKYIRKFNKDNSIL